MSQAKITPVILSGGAGTRLWPLSREAFPKQLLALVGDETMLQRTARRVADRNRFRSPIVIAGAAHADVAESQLAAIGLAVSLLVVEPSGRDTAPAIALAALHADPTDLLLVMPSDHLIGDEAALHFAVEAAAPLAADGWLLTFGIGPDRPETGYGYIRRGAPLADGVYRAEAFVEKPDAETARGLLGAGGHYWNGGIFLFRADAMLSALEQHAPDIMDATRVALAAGTIDGTVIRPDASAFVKVRSLSIDHAVMEKAERIAVVPVDMAWSDLGSWDALYEVLEKDLAGNAVTGEVLAIDSTNCLLRSDGRRIVAIGIDDLIVIETADAILVVPRGQGQRVREAIVAMRASGAT